MRGREEHEIRPQGEPDEEPLVRIAARRAIKQVKKDATTPEFGRLLQYQATSAAGDSLLALALATTLFFAVPDATESKTRLVLYLVLTVAPFAVVSPVLARVLDRYRGSLRWAMVLSALGRATLAWLMASRIDTLTLFPLAFGLLLLSRASLIVRGAILPGLVPEDRSLVEANSAMSRIGAIAGLVAGIPGVILLKWPGPETEMLVTAAVFYIGVVPAVRLPTARGRIGTMDRVGAQAKARGLNVRQGLFAVAGMRSLVGFLVFHLAFALRREDIAVLGLGMLVGSAAIGNLVGAIIAPRLRRAMKEEGILLAALVVSGVAGVAAGFFFSVLTAGLFVFVFGVATGAAKLAFDSIVQREIPEGGRGWAFARFESVLQLAWVAGGLVPLLIAIPGGAGVVIVGIAANALGIVFVLGRSRNGAPRQSSDPPPSLGL